MLRILTESPLVVVVLATLITSACKSGPPTPRHRERAVAQDTACTEPSKPSAYFYPAANRTDYGPDDPFADGCQLWVADHLFCCPHAPRATDR